MSNFRFMLVCSGVETVPGSSPGRRTLTSSSSEGTPCRISRLNQPASAFRSPTMSMRGMAAFRSMTPDTMA